jgi:hypothetical protein
MRLPTRHRRRLELEAKLRDLDGARGPERSPSAGRIPELTDAEFEQLLREVLEEPDVNEIAALLSRSTEED